MKKRYNKELVLLLTCASVCLLFMAFLTMVFPALVYNQVGVNYQVDGIFAIFGGKIKDTTCILKFNVISLIGYLLPLISIITTVLGFKNKTSVMYFVSSFICVIATALILMEGLIVGKINDISNLSLGFGPILGVIFLIIAFVLNLYSGLEKRKNN